MKRAIRIIIIMRIYLIVYNLSKPDRYYESFYKVIRSLGSSCWCLSSAWLVKTDLSINEITDKMNGYIDPDDALIVAPVMSFVGWVGLNSECRKWLGRNL